MVGVREEPPDYLIHVSIGQLIVNWRLICAGLNFVIHSNCPSSHPDWLCLMSYVLWPMAKHLLNLSTIGAFSNQNQVQDVGDGCDVALSGVNDE